MTTLVSNEDESGLLRLGLAFCSAKALLSAIELGVFDALHEDGPTNADELGVRLGLHPQATPPFLDLLVALGLLSNETGRYVNTPSVDRYLVRGRPSDLRHLLERANHTHYAAWGDLTDALRVGGHRANADYSVMRENPHRLRRFLNLMDALTNSIGPQLAEAVDWRQVRQVVDVGGARGNLLSHVLKAHSHLIGKVFDLPHNAEPFANHIAALGLTDRVTFQPGDFFIDPLPETDALIFGHVLHDWTPQRRALLVQRAYDAIRPGGLLIIYEALLDEPLTGGGGSAADYQEPTEHEDPVARLDMLLFTEGGSEYTEQECRQLLSEVGFHVLDVRPLGERDTLVVARRP